MGKIPVGATISRAYGFVFGNLLGIVKVSWLPLLLMFAISYLMSPMLINAFQGGGSGGAFGIIALFYVVLMATFLVLFVAIAQFALGINPNPGWVNFPLGMTVLRLVGAFVLVGLIFAGLWLCVVVVGVAIGAAAGAAAGASKAVIGLVAIAVMIISVCVFTYVLVRLTFLLLPVVVAENGIGIGRSWKLGKGNFWRMLGIMILMLLPLIVVELVAFKFFMPPMPIMPAGTPPAAVQAAMRAWDAALLTQVQHNWYLVYPVGAVVAVIVYGVLVCGQCFAYRALVPAEAESEVFS